MKERHISKNVSCRALLFFMACCIMLMDQSAWAQRKRKSPRPHIELSPVQQLEYRDKDYLTSIKSVYFHKTGDEQSFPLIELNTSDQISLSFDDLRADNRNYSYTIVHCQADWTPSPLLPLEYIDGLTEERVYEAYNAGNTLQPYMHYSVSFPANNSLKPRLSGNYLLKVYDDNDPDRIILTRRFYVLAKSMGIEAQLRPSYDVTKRRSNQKVDLVLHTGQINSNNPYEEVKVLVMQNQRPDIQQWLRSPSNIRPGQLIYHDNKTLDFAGGNQFRSIDLRSFRSPSEKVASIEKDSTNQIHLLPDANWKGQAYSYLFDEGGNFFVRNNDFDDSDLEGDYAHVNFSLQANEPSAGEKVYLVGKFNNYELNEENEMHYDPKEKSWQLNYLFKQGLYDYTYMSLGPDGKRDGLKFSGSHFETRNSYQLLVYYRRPSSRWDELVGFFQINNMNQSN